MNINFYQSLHTPHKSRHIVEPAEPLSPEEEKDFRAEYGNLLLDHPAGILNSLYQRQAGDVVTLDPSAEPFSAAEHTKYKQLFGTRFVEQYLD